MRVGKNPGIVFWGLLMLFPFLFFSRISREHGFEGPDVTFDDINAHFSMGTHVYYITVVILSAAAVYANSSSTDLLMIEGAILGWHPHRL